MIQVFEQNLRAHLHQKPKRNVAQLPVPAPPSATPLKSQPRPTYINSVPTRSPKVVYAVRERSDGRNK
jgi:hypothetical protein